MTLDDVDAAVGVLQTVLAALQAAVPGQSGRPGAEFRYACGDLLAQASVLIPTAAISAPLQDCFDQAVQAGATLNGMVGVRAAATANPPGSQPAVVIAGLCYCLALGSEAKLLAASTFASSGMAMTALAVFGGAMDAAQEWAADNGLPACYQGLLALGAAVSRDLTTRAARLPMLASYNYSRGTTSHVLAYRLYGDTGRADELRGENAVNHPAFMPPSGVALSE